MNFSLIAFNWLPLVSISFIYFCFHALFTVLCYFDTEFELSISAMFNALWAFTGACGNW